MIYPGLYAFFPLSDWIPDRNDGFVTLGVTGYIWIIAMGTRNLRVYTTELLDVTPGRVLLYS